MNPLITPTDLAARLPDPRLRLFDCTTFLHPQPDSHRMRVENGQRIYDEGHLPGAVLIDLQRDLSDPANGLRFTAPAPEDLARRFMALGVGEDTEVALYSGTEAWWATRVWWMLHGIGFDRAAVLDGGLRAWREAGLPLSREPHAARPAAGLVARPRPVFTDREGVLAALSSGSAVVLNCLRAEQHEGSSPIHYGRPGRIQGSVNLPAASLVDAQGCFRDADSLAALFAERGIVPGRAVIAYCGGGIAATADAFALRALLGRDQVLVYDNSLQEWATDPALPMSVGAG